MGMANSIKDRLDVMEMQFYGISRPTYTTNAASVAISNVSKVLFTSYPTAMVRTGVLSVSVQTFSASAPNMTVTITDADGNVVGSPGIYKLATGTFTFVYPFYYKGMSKLTISVVLSTSTATIGVGQAMLLVQGGK